jgi:aconitate hydratase
MGKSMTQKILEAHIVEGKWAPGTEISIKIDQTLTQDATGTMAYLQFEAMGIPRVKTEVSVSYVDHNTIQIGFENADDHRYLQTVAAKYGILYSRAGNGICHQSHLERFGVPGKTLLGSDSHTPTGGGLGMVAIGAGGLDVAVAMGGGPFYLTCPKVVRVNLLGKLKPWVSAKDVILKVLEMFTVKGNVGVVLEYAGPGVKTLTVPERATITNMGAETGVTFSLFPSDEVTKQFMEAQGRGQNWKALEADPDAVYDREVTIELNKLVPLTAYPHSPGNIKKVKDMAGTKVDQVCIGSCTNSSYRDLMIVATVLKKKEHINPNTSVVIAPGSRQVYNMIAKNGALATLISAGCRIAESACGFCIGNSQSPQSKAVSLRTSNRNFEARSGTKDAQVYLVSPETAVAAAVTGEFTDPRELGIRFPKIRMPDKFLIDDTMILKPAADPSKVTIIRGPNIGDPPKNEPLADNVKGVVTIKVGDKITTDHIIPAGDKMKYRSNVPKYADFVFDIVDNTFSKRAKENKAKGLANIIVAGESYGQGSSREHAAMCPMYLGVKVVLAKSLERIHTANLINFGIVPLVFENPADYDGITAGDELVIEGFKKALETGGKIVVKNKTKGKDIPVKHNLSGRDRNIVLSGGTLNYIRAKNK